MSFTSCSDDDDDNPTSSIVGKWECQDIDGYYITFKSNKTGLEEYKMDGNYLSGSFEYSYNPEQQQVTIVGSNENLELENGTYRCRIGNTMMEFGGLTFKKK